MVQTSAATLTFFATLISAVLGIKIFKYYGLNKDNILFNEGLGLVSSTLTAEDCGWYCQFFQCCLTFTFLTGPPFPVCRFHYLPADVLAASVNTTPVVAPRQAVTLRPAEAKKPQTGTVKYTTPSLHVYKRVFDFGIDVTCKTAYAFQVQACQNVFVALSYDTSFTGNTFQIALGVEGNNRSFIRKISGCCEDLGDVQLASVTFSPLNCTAQVEVWVSWDSGLVQAGMGPTPGAGAFLAYQNPAPNYINYLGIATANVTGVFYLPRS